MTLPARLKFGTFMAPFHQVGEDPTLSLERDLEVLQWLDYLGFDEAWIGEHHSAGWEIIASPEVFIGVAAERTKHIKLGTGVISLPYHHPLMVANRMVLLDHLTRGRVMLGVGPGALVTDALMLGIEPDTQRPRMDEAMGAIIRLLKDSTPYTHKSEWFTLNEARLHLRPFTQPHMPLVVAAAGSPSGMVLAEVRPRGAIDIESAGRPDAERLLEDRRSDGGRARQDGEPRRVAPGAARPPRRHHGAGIRGRQRAGRRVLARLLRRDDGLPAAVRGRQGGRCQGLR
jgi:limonene 1,2-monooxygenase